MNDNKDLIEVIKVGGVEIGIQRDYKNCMVNMTGIAKHYRKKVSNWTRLQETEEFLESLIEIRKKEFMELGTSSGNTDLAEAESVAQIRAAKILFSRQSGNYHKQGTWCTDYRVAIRFAMWLDPYFSILVISTFLKIINGEFILDENGCVKTSDGRKWVTRETYCKELGRSPSSFAGLKAHYPHHFEFVNGQHVMSREFFLYQSKKDNFEEERISFKLPVEDKRQLALPFAEYEEITEG